jgi:hypothetical protein
MKTVSPRPELKSMILSLGLQSGYRTARFTLLIMQAQSSTFDTAYLRRCFQVVARTLSIKIKQYQYLGAARISTFTRNH